MNAQEASASGSTYGFRAESASRMRAAGSLAADNTTHYSPARGTQSADFAIMMN